MNCHILRPLFCSCCAVLCLLAHDSFESILFISHSIAYWLPKACDSHCILLYNEIFFVEIWFLHLTSPHEGVESFWSSWSPFSLKNVANKYPSQEGPRKLSWLNWTNFKHFLTFVIYFSPWTDSRLGWGSQWSSSGIFFSGSSFFGFSIFNRQFFPFYSRASQQEATYPIPHIDSSTILSKKHDAYNNKPTTITFSGASAPLFA